MSRRGINSCKTRPRKQFPPIRGTYVSESVPPLSYRSWHPELSHRREHPRGVLFGARHSLSRIDRQRDCVSTEKAHYNRHECTLQIYGLQILGSESIVASNETEVVGKVRSVRTLGLHIPFGSLFLLARFKRDGQTETTAGDFCLAEISKLILQVLEVRNQGLSPDKEAAVVDGDGCAAAHCVYQTCLEPFWSVICVEGFLERGYAAPDDLLAVALLVNSCS